MSKQRLKKPLPVHFNAEATLSCYYETVQIGFPCMCNLEYGASEVCMRQKTPHLSVYIVGNQRFRRRMEFRLLCGLWILLDLSVYCYTSNPTNLPDIEDQQFIQDCVNKHNYFRSKVSPSASNMRRMTWDPSLAKTARAWAKKCHFNHNIYLKTPGKAHPNFTSVGENLWTGSLSLFSVEHAVRNWYNEVKYYNFENNGCTKVCGHYTQVVWATSYKVGCAVQFCQKVSGYEQLSNGAHFVCNYGPAGNYPVQPYKTGGPCSECNGETCVDSLCGNPERDRWMSYSNWSPDWDTSSHSACDSYCIAVLILRTFFVFFTFGTVAILSKQYPQMFMYE
ncbi:glioma pathogenesis-related protein 1 [Elgaria multicarinata webbii]|uniref:glioma pathogenesis-related protein 1 n=1 Tax=Elgaria multicarinata webbii TaxID=159646 RepID=UPI002FCD6700